MEGIELKKRLGCRAGSPDPAVRANASRNAAGLPNVSAGSGNPAVQWRKGIAAWRSVAAVVCVLAVATIARAANISIADLGLELVWIEPGTFTMGSPPDEGGRDKAEGVQRRVTFSKGFWIGKTEVTQRQYEGVIGTNPSHFKNVGPDAPVEEVSWDDAMEYCAKLTERERAAGRLPEGYAFTLPTEAQWEYACRAGTTEMYPGYLDAMAWYDQNSDGTTHRVAQKQPNKWGLYDMAGNVIEWCRDWYGDYARTDETDPTGPSHGHFRMARGGSWRTGAVVCRSAARAGGSQGRRDYTIGFRVALSAVDANDAATRYVEDPEQLLPGDPPAARRLSAKLAAFEKATGVTVLLRLQAKEPPAEEDKIPGAYMRAWATKLGTVERGVLVAYFAEEDDWRMWIGNELAAKFAGRQGTVQELTKSGAIHDAKEALFAAAKTKAEEKIVARRRAAPENKESEGADRVRFDAEAILDALIARLGGAR